VKPSSPGHYPAHSLLAGNTSLPGFGSLSVGDLVLTGPGSPAETDCTKCREKLDQAVTRNSRALFILFGHLMEIPAKKTPQDTRFKAELEIDLS